MHPRQSHPSGSSQPYPQHAPPSTYCLPPPSQGMLAAYAVTAALSNPHVQNFPQYNYPQASHYAQAYAQYYPDAAIYGAGTTAEGYTLSSTYVPSQHAGQYGPLPTIQGLPAQAQRLPNRTQAQPHWYQAGNARCAKPGCAFQGSQKAVETHMMDRHLIYPPGSENRKRKSEWDADPSLKGKIVPIQGTTVKLDTPEAIAEWIAERKKRFPTASRVEEKKKKLQEAIARGQLSLEDARFPHRKKRRLNEHTDAQQHAGRGGIRERGGWGRGRGAGRGGGRGRGRGRGPNESWQARTDSAPAPTGGEPSQPVSSAGFTQQVAAPVPPTLGSIFRASSSDSDGYSDSGSDSDGAPEVISSKQALEHESSGSESESSHQVVPEAGAPPAVQAIQPIKRSTPKQPRRLPRNPFASRPSLLRNLLHPEIRMTVSNLSQAIRFLVDNDFLENVELNPGQAADKKIEVVGETSATDMGSNPAHSVP